MDFISILSIFVLACFVGYYVVWSVTPALHTPLKQRTRAQPRPSAVSRCESEHTQCADGASVAVSVGKGARSPGGHTPASAT